MQSPLDRREPPHLALGPGKALIGMGQAFCVSKASPEQNKTLENKQSGCTKAGVGTGQTLCQGLQFQ